MNDVSLQIEDLSAPMETQETISITVQDLTTVGSDIVHANLFGSFLICGTLVGLALFRGRYGS